MNQIDILRRRMAMLISACKDRGIDWKTAIGVVPPDDLGVQCARLSSKLGYRISDVLGSTKNVAQLQEEARQIEEDRAEDAAPPAQRGPPVIQVPYGHGDYAIDAAGHMLAGDDDTFTWNFSSPNVGQTGLAYIQLTALTGFSSALEVTPAAAFINPSNTPNEKPLELVGPLPWLGTHNSLPWGIKIMSFKNALLRPDAQNEFRIKLSNTQSNTNWIIIDKVICHYRLGLRVF